MPRAAGPLPIEPEDVKDGFQPMPVERESAHVELRLRRRVQGLDQGRGVGLDAQHHAVLLVQAEALTRTTCGYQPVASSLNW